MIDSDYLYELRKKLHKKPEIAFKEFKTQDIIIDELSEFKDVLKLTKFNPTGLLFEYSEGEGEYILFRADMDALPIKENTNCSFRSENEGFMHACGHDIHMTILIGLIRYVVTRHLKLNILFLFQPAEEGYGGAEHLLKTGEFEKYNISSAYALHVTGAFPVGSIGIKSGIIFGIPQEFNIEFYGKAGHVATPQKGNDAFLAAMAFYNEMITLMSKRFPAQDAVIFHVGKITAGTVRNIIPEYCRFEGTTRCLNPENKEKINDLINTIASGIEKSYQVKIKVSFLSSYDAVNNDQNLVEELIKILKNEDIVVNQVESSMTGEDFGFFTSRYPGVLFWLGSANEENQEDLHSSKFLPEEKSIDTGLQIFKILLNYKLKHK